MSTALPLVAFSWCWLVMAIVMMVLWAVQWRGKGTVGVVDVAWSYGTGCLVVALLYLASNGEPGRRVLLAVMATAWAIRLGTHLLQRLRRKGEDGRYVYMRQAMGRRAQPLLFIFFQVQAFWAVLFALPVWAAAEAQSPFPSAWDIIGLSLWLAAIAGEHVSDQQLRRFLATPGNSGRVCAVGLWRYSRHPNYFFEWLQWCAYAIIATASPFAWLAYGGAVLMYVFLVYITGIPYLERRALQSRGDAYLAYQRSTNRFFPWIPRQP